MDVGRFKLFFPFLFGLGLEDGDAPTFWLLLHCRVHRGPLAGSMLLWQSLQDCQVPGPQEYVKYWPFRLLLVALGCFFAYFWCSGIGLKVERAKRLSP